MDIFAVGQQLCLSQLMAHGEEVATAMAKRNRYHAAITTAGLIRLSPRQMNESPY